MSLPTHSVQPDDDGAVSPPYCAPCPLARTAVLLEGGGLAPVFSEQAAAVASAAADVAETAAEIKQERDQKKQAKKARQQEKERRKEIQDVKKRANFTMSCPSCGADWIYDNNKGFGNSRQRVGFDILGYDDFMDRTELQCMECSGTKKIDGDRTQMR